ncbi:DUF5813 family protein [Halorubrum distributum]|uniref:Uncharacterized protein n=2 Tax=Halorubrum distributum TaxID=29283 RepID=M0D5Q5_9EURY|nr:MULTISPECIES: DUF5813 family protein [Halorubrum distributum group]ELZ30188.1 hypothetical protein C473_13759 [Halorubrum terrestre JCM 10247]MDV7348757.1 DUF5813 family protein [Halorubrum distributum]MYL16190.1 hypothetical protein [Halorubrum terrestre]
MRETEGDDAENADGEGDGPTDELPDRVRRAFADHGSFERDGDGWVSTTTAFDGRVRAEPAEDGRVEFTVAVRVPTLSAVTADEVADVVEDGWADTFERRAVDVGGVTRKRREFDPVVEREGDEIAVIYELADINERRGVDDAGALIDFVEGTYVQGVIPGYEYTAPVSDLLSAARQQGGGGPV